jgi:Toastrack DUF4097
MIILILLAFITLPALGFSQLNFELEESYPVNKKVLISLKTKNAKIRIHGEERNDVFLQVNRLASPKGKIEDDGYSLEISNQSDRLLIEEKKEASTGMVRYKNLEYNISLLVPYRSSLLIYGRDDTYFIDSIDGKIEMDSDDGDVRINFYKGPELKIKVEEGNVNLTNSGPGNLFIRMGDGDLEIMNSIFKDIVANLGSGDLDLHQRFSDVHTLKFDMEDGALKMELFGNGGKIEARTIGGEISASPEFKIEKKSKGFVQYTIGDGFGKIFANTRDGDILITKKAKGE